jgi:hypothetical protein
MFLPFSVPQRGQRCVFVGGAAAAGRMEGAAGADNGAPHVWQNAFCGGLSRWHWRQSIQREWNRP